MANSLSELLAALSPFDPADLVATAGGLQLLPENAERIVRLEALAHVAASIGFPSSAQKISSPRLRSVLNGTLYQIVGRAEDPPPDCLVEEIPFFGGSYRVFPGAGESFSFIARNLITAIFLSSEITHGKFLHDSYAVVMAILSLSNEIALRAGLRRGLEPIPTRSDVTVPFSAALHDLKQCVIFSEAQLKHVLSQRKLGVDAVAPFITEGGTDCVSSYTVEVGPLHARPIVKFGTTYIVASPSALLDALTHQLNCVAIQYNLQSEYAVAYNHAVRASTVESLRFLRNEILAVYPTKGALPPTVSECTAAMDSDKVVHVLVVTDELKNYDLTGKTRRWDMDELSASLVERMNEVVGQIQADHPELKILILLVHQAMGRSYGLRLPANFGKSLFHMVSAADLRTISVIDSDDPLAVWSFAEAAEQLHEKKVFVQAWNALDEYGFFREHEFSFYVGDERLPNVISIHPADFARPLRCKVAQRLNVQSVPHYKEKGTIEVRSLHNNSEIPIYIPVGPLRGAVAVFVDALDCPLWILGPEKTENDAIYGELGDAIAFWLWQAKDALQGMLKNRPILIVNMAVAEDLESDSSVSRQTSPPVIVEPTSSSNIKLVFTSAFRFLVGQADNRADRELLKSLLLSLTRSNPDKESTYETGAVIDKVAPLGLKKKLLSFNPGADPSLDSRGLPPYRGVRKYQIGKLLDSVGEHLAATNIPIGAIPDEERTSIFNGIVGYCYGKLKQAVASLAEEGALEFVISQHEAILHRQSVRKATIATRLACFGADSKILDSFQKDLKNEARDAISIRFLIEYLATIPPSGQCEITLERFDELLMLASEITNFGMLSDSVRNQLADLKLSVVPSGRLGIMEDQYRRASKQYMEAFASHEMYLAPRIFRRLTLMPEKDAETPELMKNLDLAAMAEFGYSMGDLSSFTGELLRLSDPLRPFGIVKVAYLKKSLREATRWSDELITKLIDSMLLKPRTDFLKPESPFTPAEVYPWRFNRSLSYLRRPLIEREREDGPEIVWGYRHVYHAHENLLKLCFSGRLRATSIEMKNFMSSVTNRQGSIFNDQVASLFSYPSFQVKKRVNKIPGTTGLDNLGDLDVLVADLRRKRVDVIECKDLSNARTPHEMSLEIEHLLGSERAKNPIVTRHGKRVNWVKQNLQAVLKWIGVPDKKNWRVDGYIVVDHPLMAPYLKHIPLRVIAFAELESELVKRHSSSNSK